jgi:hypothetical protein
MRSVQAHLDTSQQTRHERREFSGVVIRITFEGERHPATSAASGAKAFLVASVWVGRVTKVKQG